MPGVTIQAGYGAGGSVVAPAVAQLLGLPLLDRAISVAVAAKLQVSVDEAVTAVEKRGFTSRFLSLLVPLAGGVLGAGTDAAPEVDPLPDDAANFREQAETIMRSALVDGAVILGRAGSAALRNEPDVLRVRLFGPAQARIAQAVRVENIDADTARVRLRQVDAARDHYIWRLYKIRADDPAIFHLQIDSTVVPLDACATLIASAYRAMISQSASTI